MTKHLRTGGATAYSLGMDSRIAQRTAEAIAVAVALLLTLAAVYCLLR